MENLLYCVETNNGFNVIIDGRWAACFSAENREQIEFLIENTNKAFKERILRSKGL